VLVRAPGDHDKEGELMSETTRYVTTGTATCPDCREAFDVEWVDCGVAYVWHGVCCGWGQQVHSDDVTTSPGTQAMPEQVYV
jgi:Zn ribbon nucleic-acid-binding protein